MVVSLFILMSVSTWRPLSCQTGMLQCIKILVTVFYGVYKHRARSVRASLGGYLVM